MTEAFGWEKPEHLLNFELIGDSLDALLKATENKVEREWPSKLGGSGWHSAPFLLFLKIARWTYVASLYLLADKPEDPKRHLEYAIAVPPLNRTILDSVFNVVFIFDDFDDRLCWYFQSGLEEVQRKLARFKRKYSGDPAWSPWFLKAETLGNPFAESRDKAVPIDCLASQKGFRILGKF